VRAPGGDAVKGPPLDAEDAVAIREPALLLLQDVEPERRLVLVPRRGSVRVTPERRGPNGSQLVYADGRSARRRGSSRGAWWVRTRRKGSA
jgi:hypothetical protein